MTSFTVSDYPPEFEAFSTKKPQGLKNSPYTFGFDHSSYLEQTYWDPREAAQNMIPPLIEKKKIAAYYY